MVPDTVGGLPTHVLVIHAVVVLVPLGALGAIGYALIAPWRGALRWTVMAVLTAGLAAVPVATSAGEHLQADLTAKGQLGGSAADAVRSHVEWGDRVLWPVVATWLLYVAMVVLTRPSGVDRRSGAPRPAGRHLTVVLLGVLVVVGAGVSIAFVVLAGHTGATAIWNPAG